MIALEEMPKRLGEDHANARFLAEALERMPGIRLSHRVQTNIVIFDVTGTGLTPPEFSARLKERGVLMPEALDPEPLMNNFAREGLKIFIEKREVSEL